MGRLKSFYLGLEGKVPELELAVADDVGGHDYRVKKMGWGYSLKFNNKNQINGALCLLGIVCIVF